MMLRSFPTFVASVAIALTSGLSSVADAAPKRGGARPGANASPLAAARDAARTLDYKTAIERANAALVEPNNTHEALVDLYRILGTANGVLGNTEPAADAFTRLLAIEPDFKLPRGTSPKITAPYREAGGFWIDRPGGLKLQAEVPSEVSGDQAIPITVRLDDPLQMTATIRLQYRRAGDVEYRNIDLQAAASLRFSVPASAVPADSSAYRVDVKVLALDSHGGELRALGDARAPLSFEVHTKRVGRVALRDDDPSPRTTGDIDPTSRRTDEKQPLVKKWWFWTAIVLGAAVIGGGAYGIYYAVKPATAVEFTTPTVTIGAPAAAPALTVLRF